MTRRDAICLALAAVAGGLAFLVDLHAREVQSTVIVLGVTGLLLGFARPRLFWLSGVIAGGVLPAAYCSAALLGIGLPQWPEPNPLAASLAVIPALAATTLGALLAR